MTPYELAYEYAMHTNKCVFLTGKAGTGKTTFLRKLRVECKKQMVVVAPTGVAAINAEGVTIHSFFQLPPQLFLPTESARRTLFSEMQMRDSKRKVLKHLDMLIIDEVSMVRADLLDTIDAVLRHYKHRPNQPFGGVQILFIGDLYQLSPVAKPQEWDLMRTYYDGPFFFQARVFKELQPVYLELDHVFRQTNQQFINLLNHVRENTLTAEGLAMLNSRYDPKATIPENGVLLSTHNRKVDAINQREMASLQGEEYSFDAQVKGIFPETMYPMDETLVLKQGAKVMFIKNDTSPEHLYYNGLLGRVKEVDFKHILVEANGQVIDVHTETWENIRYGTKDNSDEIEVEVVGTFEQIPLRLAWAVTIHKAQGLTFDTVTIDAEDAFAAGQVYVALSRCRTLEGITLTSKIPAHALTNAREVIDFTRMQPSVEQVSGELNESINTYLAFLLSTVYDFREVFAHMEALSRITGSKDATFNQPATSEYLHRIKEQILSLQPIAESFFRQLQHILLTPQPDYHFLQERLGAAKDYFVPKLEDIQHSLESSPAYTDNKEDAKAYEERLKELYVDFTRQLFEIGHIHENPSINYLFQLREKFIVPRLMVKAKGEEKKMDDTAVCQHPQLLEDLQSLRRALAQEENVPAYTIASTNTLIAIADTLPKTPSALMKVKGFGTKRYAKYGRFILNLVKAYARKHHL